MKDTAYTIDLIQRISEKRTEAIKAYQKSGADKDYGIAIGYSDIIDILLHDIKEV